MPNPVGNRTHRPSQQGGEGRAGNNTEAGGQHRPSPEFLEQQRVEQDGGDECASEEHLAQAGRPKRPDPDQGEVDQRTGMAGRADE